MEANAFVLVFTDGPAAGHMIEKSVEPEPVRWFCQGQEMGSEDPMEWWTMEEPPEADGVIITEYLLVAEDERETDSSGATIYHYSVAGDLLDGPTTPEGLWRGRALDIEALIQEAQEAEAAVGETDEPAVKQMHLAHANNCRLRALCLLDGLTRPVEDEAIERT